MDMDVYQNRIFSKDIEEVDSFVDNNSMVKSKSSPYFHKCVSKSFCSLFQSTFEDGKVSHSISCN